MPSRELGPIAGVVKVSEGEVGEAEGGGGVGEVRRLLRALTGVDPPPSTPALPAPLPLDLFSDSWRERLRITSDFMESGRLVPWSFKL
jgi:hypothetical protein